MRKYLVSFACASALAVSACQMSNDEEVIFAGIAGAAVGAITAKALGANSNWTIVAALAGATVGTLVARNNQTRSCAYANGDGTYRTGPCP